MINLLPTTARELALADYRHRRAVTNCCVLLALFLAALIVQASLFVNLRVKQDEAAQQLALARSRAEAGKVAAHQAEAEKFASVLGTLARARAAVPPRGPSSVLEAALAARPAGVRLRRAAYGGTDPASAKLTLEGSAATRQALLALVAALQAKQDVFTSVDSPISNLIKERDVPFTITLTIRQ